MSSHTVHPDSHANGLADGCPRCEEHAQHPLNSLDSENLRNLIQRVATGEKGRSENEQDAIENVKLALDQAGLLATIHPLALVKYINRQWGTRLIAVVHDDLDAA